MNSTILWISFFEKLGEKKNFQKYILNAKVALKKFNLKIKFASSEVTKLEGKKFFKSKDYKLARKFLNNGKSIRHLNLIQI